MDLNNNIVEVVNISAGSTAYYKINNGNFELLDSADNSDDGIDKERTELEEKYRKSYNFVEISTELTNNNIDTYIK